VCTSSVVATWYNMFTIAGVPLCFSISDQLDVYHGPLLFLVSALHSVQIQMHCWFDCDWNGMA
jgi:hypothetical protein